MRRKLIGFVIALLFVAVVSPAPDAHASVVSDLSNWIQTSFFGPQQLGGSGFVKPVKSSSSQKKGSIFRIFRKAKKKPASTESNMMPSAGTEPVVIPVSIPTPTTTSQPTTSPVIYQSTPSSEGMVPTIVSCSDSDGGKNAQKKGSVSWKVGSKIENYTDDDGEGGVFEFSCENNSVRGDFIPCKYGASNGACNEPQECPRLACLAPSPGCSYRAGTFENGCTNPCAELVCSPDDDEEIPSEYSTPTNDSTPRISYWYGKVNQHVAGNTWKTDSDGTSGANVNKLQYCQKFWPKTTSVADYKSETITSWRTAGNTGEPYSSVKLSFKCVTETGVICPLPKPCAPLSSNCKYISVTDSNGCVDSCAEMVCETEPELPVCEKLSISTCWETNGCYWDDPVKKCFTKDGINDDGCTDTDGGINYSIKGIAHGWANESDRITKFTTQDSCNSGDLIEFHCSSDEVTVGTRYSCPNGCFEGTCRGEVFCPKFSCLSPKPGCTHISVTDRNGCVNPCADTICKTIEPVCPLPKPCAAPAPNCKYLSTTDSNGCIDTCAELVCEDEPPVCPIVSCVTPKTGCTHISSTDRNGCVNPCADTICKTIEPVCPLPKPCAQAPDGCFYQSVTDSNGCIDACADLVCKTILNETPTGGGGSSSDSSIDDRYFME